jgi:pyridoxamine 5'-phosphate oxidase family protein
MSVFTDEERTYLEEPKLGRLATVGPDGQPHVVPVGFRYNAELDAVDIGGRALDRTKKFRDVKANPRVALVVDDVLPPWRPRSVEIQGRAEALGEGDAALIRITPGRIIARGLDGPPHAQPAGGGAMTSRPARRHRAIAAAAPRVSIRQGFGGAAADAIAAAGRDGARRVVGMHSSGSPGRFARGWDRAARGRGARP